MTEIGEAVAVALLSPDDPTLHRIGLELTPMPDAKARSAYPWWVARKGTYGYTAFSAEVTDGHHDGALDGIAGVTYEGIPAGSCTFLFTNFYDDIEAALKKGTSGPL